MNIAEILPLITALLGFVACEALNISRGLKDTDTPDKFSWSYYFSRPKNITQLIMNACGTGVLFISRHEVLGFADRIPLVSDFLGYGTPFLVCGLIGFVGGYVVRFVAKKLSAAE
jgi:ABC-type antimicrobial peptide transport system permease subunit